MSEALPALLRATARAYPDRPALRDATRSYTYAELLAEVHQLARQLRDLGVRRGDLVECRMPRSAGAVIAQAAVFAAGGVFVPLSEKAPPVAKVSVPDVVDVGLPASQPCPDPRPEDLAYVIHTSGTSGKPKPVAVSHGAIAHSTRARLARYSAPVESFALVSPMTFDSSLAGIWWTFATGGCLTVVDDVFAELPRLMRSGVSHTLLTPSAYRVILSEVDSAALSAVVVAGEPCHEDLVAEHHRKLPGVELVNEYGPTEAAVWCASATLRPGAEVTVGTAIDGVRLHLSEDGEVLVSGPTLATGYLDDPELTATRFVTVDGERAYRTGDLGQFTEHGDLRLLGRMDGQVKIRGFRVEPDGVATVLNAHPGVQQVAVTARNGRLVAYVAPAWDTAEVSTELRAAWTDIVDDLADESADELSGWTSSYTGAALSEEDMAEWVDATVALAGNPRTVLELGCGTGLLLSRIAPATDRYLGIDVSAATLETLRDKAPPQVELRVGEARDVPDERFDLVVCNSVSQYFPDAGYLADVLAGARRAGTRVVLGDVRDLGLREAFHAAVVLHRASEDTSVAVLRERWHRRIERDTQLSVDPRWFTGSVRPRRGRRRNEMNDFRFDVVLEHDDRPPLEIEWHPWSGIEAARELIGTGKAVGFTRVPNQRSAGACAVRAVLLRGGDSADSVDAAWLRAVAAEAERAAVHPEDLLELAGHAQLSRAAGWPNGEFDVVFSPVAGKVDWPTGPKATELVSDPVRQHLLATAGERLVPALREHTARELEEHERPSAYVVLPALPLTAHGKVDYTALPAPATERPRLTTPYAPTVLRLERHVAGVLAELLGVDRVGRHDNFVELGGDSLLAARAALRLGRELGVDVPIRILFDQPTVARVAAWLSAAAPAAEQTVVELSDTDRLPFTGPQFMTWGHDLQHAWNVVAGPECALAVTYRISGRLDRAALRAAVDEVVRRHEALRTALFMRPDEAYQIVGEPRTGVLRTVDAADLEGALENLVHDEPLDPKTGRVFAADLVSASPVQHLFSLRLHHMVSDGWSLDLVEREISALYHGESLPPAPSYRAQVQRMAAVAPTPKPEDLKYWSDKFAEAEPIELVPKENLDPTAPHRTHIRSITVPGAQFLRFARERRATLYAALYAVLAPLIAAATDDPDVRLLSVNAARRSEELERTVGFFLDALLLRDRVEPGGDFAARLAAASAELNAALRHDSAPLPVLCQAIPDMLKVFALSQPVVFEALAPVSEIRFGDCVVDRRDPFDEGYRGLVFQVPVALTVLARQEGANIRLAALYDSAFVSESYVDELLGKMRSVIGKVI